MLNRIITKINEFQERFDSLKLNHENKIAEHKRMYSSALAERYISTENESYVASIQELRRAYQKDVAGQFADLRGNVNRVVTEVAPSEMVGMIELFKLGEFTEDEVAAYTEKYGNNYVAMRTLQKLLKGTKQYFDMIHVDAVNSDINRFEPKVMNFISTYNGSPTMAQSFLLNGSYLDYDNRVVTNFCNKEFEITDESDNKLANRMGCK